MARLLYVFLRGAADGLSMAVPPDGELRDARPTLALPDNAVLDIGDGWSLHPKMVGIGRRYSEGTVALVPAVRMANADRSHFSSQELLETCGVGGTGWIGRILAQTPNDQPTPFRAVSVGSPAVPTTLRGSNDVIGATTLDDLRVRTDAKGVDVDPAWFGQMWESAADGPARAGSLAAMDVQATLDKLEDGSPPRERGFDGSEAGRAFAEADRVWEEDLGTEVVMVNLSRWDTHDQQDPDMKGVFSQILGALDSGLDTLLTRRDSADDPITTLIVTEFGRRVQENASRGTDHGSGSLAIVVGAGVVGGIRGEWPGLRDLVEGDVRPVNSLEAVLGEVASGVLGVDDVEAVIPGATSAAAVGVLR